MSVRPPVLPDPGPEYSRSQLYTAFSALTAYFERANRAHPINASVLNIDTGTLPTQAAVASLKSGDVYRDTAAGNVLKIVP